MFLSEAAERCLSSPTVQNSYGHWNPLTVNKYDVIHDCQRFFRSLRWPAVFGHPPKRRPPKPDDDVFTEPFQTATRHRERPYRGGTFAEVECYVIKCLTEARNLQFKPSKRSNLTPEESSALRNLHKRDNIVVTPADKGCTVVVWDRNVYIEEAYRQLDNPTNYQSLKKPILSADQKEISKTGNLIIIGWPVPTDSQTFWSNTSQSSQRFICCPAESTKSTTWSTNRFSLWLLHWTHLWLPGCCSTTTGALVHIHQRQHPCPQSDWRYQSKSKLRTEVFVHHGCHILGYMHSSLGWTEGSTIFP